jgi:hypothetical protein
LALWKIINEDDAVLISKYQGENFVALSAGHSDITRFHPLSPIATGNHLDGAEKFQKLLRRLALLTFLIRVQAFWDPLHRELPHVHIFNE